MVLKVHQHFTGIVLLVLLSTSGLIAQQQPEQADFIKGIWPGLSARLDETSGDESFQFLLEPIIGYCGRDFSCLYSSYERLIQLLERRFHLQAAVYVCEQQLELARQHGSDEQIAHVYLDLNRFHGALGNEGQAVENADLALVYFERAGNQAAVTRTRMNKLEQSLQYRSLEEVLVDMDSLLAEAKRQQDSIGILFLHLRLANLKIGAGRYDEAAAHVAFLDQVKLSDPLQLHEYAIPITAALAHADLALIAEEWEEAEGYLKTALRLCEEEPSRWLEIRTLHSLAMLAWEHDRTKEAKQYLNRALARAQELELHDHLAGNYELQAMIAEHEERYEDALAYTKAHHYHQEQFEARSAGFNIQSYQLEREKEQLAAEKANQALELKLREKQLNSVAAITIMAVLLALVLTWAFINLRRRKENLIRQNKLIQRQAKRLEDLDTAKSRFFTNVSHELRTPLSLVLGPISSLLKENRLSSRQEQLLQLARRNGSQLEQLVNEILDLRKLEMGKMQLQEQATPLVPFFRRYAAQFESFAQGKGVELSFHTMIDERTVALIDHTKCRQILYNLLSNACKFTPAGGRVEVSLGLKEEALQLWVRDSGPGIHPDDLPHLFDRYFQTNQTNRPAEGGTGVGLALCKEYAQLFGGDIIAESEWGKGSIFRLHFPVTLVEESQSMDLSEVEVAPALAEAGPREVPPPNQSGDALPCIMIVEDNLDLQQYLQLILADRYRVIVAEHGQAALEHLKGTPDIQLIISDLMMPVMDGFQLLEQLKGSDATRHLPVIMLTARAEMQDKLRALRIGVDDYLLKPFVEEELLARVANLLDYQAIREAEVAAEVPANPEASARDHEWLETFENHLRDHLADDRLTIPDLALEFAMSESTLLRQLKRLTGLSPQQYLQELRLAEARRLLENRVHDTVAKVASEVGYTDSRSFTRRFKRRYGKLPSSFVSG